MNGDTDGEVAAYFSEYIRPPAEYDPATMFEFMNTKISVEKDNIVITGATRNKNSVYLVVHGFRNYFYVRPAHDLVTPEYVCKAYGASSVEPVWRRSFYNHKAHDVRFFKVYAPHLNDVQSMRRKPVADVKTIRIAGQPSSTYEAKIPVVSRFMLNKRISGAGWVRVAAGKHMRVLDERCQSYSQIELRAHADHVFGFNDMATVPLRAVTFDIETKRVKGGIPQPHDNDPVISIACVLETLPEHRREGLVMFVLDTCERMDGVTTYVFATEAELLVGFSAFLRAYDPDMLLGWNSINYDMFYLIRRAQTLGIIQQFGRFDQSRQVHDILAKNFESGALGKQEYYLANYRIQYDLLLLARRDVVFSPSSYALNYVAKALLNEQKHDMAYGAIATLHARNSPKHVLPDFRARAWQDALDTMRHTIRDGKFYLEPTEASRRISNIPFFQTGGTPADFPSTPRRTLVKRVLQTYEHEGCTWFRPLVVVCGDKDECERLQKQKDALTKGLQALADGQPTAAAFPGETGAALAENAALLDEEMIFFLMNGGPIYGAPGSPFGQAWELIMIYNVPVASDENEDVPVMWEATDTGRTIINQYCMQDAILASQIDKVRQYVHQYIQIARLTLTPLMDLITGGQSIRTQSKIIGDIVRIMFVKTFVVPDYDAPEKKKGEKDEKYDGAIVLDPLIGFYVQQFIDTLDFASLYPSIMCDNNICFTTHVPKHKVEKRQRQGFFGYTAPDTGEFFVMYQTLQPEHFKTLADHGIALTADHCLVNADDKPRLAALNFGLSLDKVVFLVRGVLPSGLEELKASRDAAKATIEECKVAMNALEKAGNKATDEYRLHEEKTKAYGAFEKAIKVVMNSIYGFMGAIRGKLPMIAASATVTAYGRSMIMKIKAMATRFNPITNMYACDPLSTNPRFRDGVCPYVTYVIYGDTDSIFVLLIGCTNVDEAIAIGIEMSRMATEMFAREHEASPYKLFIELSFEKCITTMLIPSKKKYNMELTLIEGGKTRQKKETKGLENKRRDTPLFLRELIDAIFALVMRGRHNKEKAYQLMIDMVLDIRARKMPMHEFLLSGSVKGDDYKGDPPAYAHTIKRIKERGGEVPQVGTRFSYAMFIAPYKSVGNPPKLTRDLGAMAETLEFAQEKKLEIDVEYYIEKYIFKPFSRIWFAIELPPIVATTQEELETMYLNQANSKELQEAAYQKIIADPRLQTRKHIISGNSYFAKWVKKE